MNPKYYHRIMGGNFRLDAIQAAVITVKLPYLNSWSEGRRKNAALYTKLFTEAGLSVPEEGAVFSAANQVILPKAVYRSEKINYHIYNQFVIRVKKRDELRDFLTKNDIGTEIYYPVPFHLQECFRNLGYAAGDFPVAEEAAATTLALPIYPELSAEQIQYVVQKIKEFIR
jgi:dTDP-4-amino-4,6-dideoxygalactose transaminase